MTSRCPQLSYKRSSSARGCPLRNLRMPPTGHRMTTSGPLSPNAGISIRADAHRWHSCLCASAPHLQRKSTLPSSAIVDRRPCPSSNSAEGTARASSPSSGGLSSQSFSQPASSLDTEIRSSVLQSPRTTARWHRVLSITRFASGTYLEDVELDGLCGDIPPQFKVSRFLLTARNWFQVTTMGSYACGMSQRGNRTGYSGLRARSGA